MILLRELLSKRDVAFQGTSVAGYPLVTVTDDFRVYVGASLMGAPVYTIVGNKLFAGNSVAGTPLATVIGDLVFKGYSVAGLPIARLQGTYSFRGPAVAGSPLVTVPSRNTGTLLAATYHMLQR
jgi:hypothetical protein